MVASVQKLEVGQLVEVDGRLYDVVWDRAGGVTLESAITVPMEAVYHETGGRPATAEEIAAVVGDIPSDGEG